MNEEPRENVPAADGEVTVDQVTCACETVCETVQVPVRKTGAFKAYLRLGLALTALLLVFQFASPVFYGWGVRLFGNSEWTYWITAYLPTYAVECLLFFLFTLKLPKEPCGPDNVARLGGKNFWLLFVMCYPFMIAGSLIGSNLASLLTGGTATNALNAIAFSHNPLKVVIIAFIGPLFEEFIFRKMLIDNLLPYGEKPAILFSAIAFGLFHTNVFQIFYAFGIGLIFGFVYVRTRKLRLTVTMHVLINFCGSVLVPFLADRAGLREAMMSGGNMDLTALAGEQFLFAALLILYVLAEYGAAITGGILVLVMGRRFVFRNTSTEIPSGRRLPTVWLNPGILLFLIGALVLTALALYGFEIG